MDGTIYMMGSMPYFMNYLTFDIKAIQIARKLKHHDIRYILDRIFSRLMGCGKFLLYVNGGTC